MRKMIYPAIVKQEEMDQLQIRYPDFPGCFSTAGSDAESFRWRATWLREHITAIAEAGLPIPAPGKLSTIDLGVEESLIFVEVLRP